MTAGEVEDEIRKRPWLTLSTKTYPTSFGFPLTTAQITSTGSKRVWSASGHRHPHTAIVSVYLFMREVAPRVLASAKARS